MLKFKDDWKPTINLVLFSLLIATEIQESLTLICYKTGQLECSRALGIIGGCPFGRLCSIANCCESITNTILLKKAEPGNPLLQNDETQVRAINSEVTPIGNPSKGFINLNLLLTICKNSTCESHSQAKASLSEVPENKITKQ